MRAQGVDVPTLVPVGVPTKPPPDTLPVPWRRKIREPGFWLIVLASAMQFLHLLPLPEWARLAVVMVGGALAKLGVEGVFEVPPDKNVWDDRQKWGESYRRVYAGQPPLMGYRPGLDPGDPYIRKVADSVFATGNVDALRTDTAITIPDRPSTRPTTAVPTSAGDVVPGSAFNPEVKP